MEPPPSSPLAMAMEECLEEPRHRREALAWDRKGRFGKQKGEEGHQGLEGNVQVFPRRQSFHSTPSKQNACGV